MSIDIAISFDEFNIILDYFKSSKYSFINDDLKETIKKCVKLLFPNITSIDSEILYLFSENLIEKISNYLFFNSNEQWKQNNYRDIKGVILMILPFINDNNNSQLLIEMTDLNQFLYSGLQNSIPSDLKDFNRNNILKSDFKFGNMSLGLLDVNNNTPIYESDNKMKLIYKIIHHNYIGILKTLQIMNGKYYINWVNIVPLEENFKNSELYKKTYNGLNDFKIKLASNNNFDIYNFLNNYYGLWFGNIYNVIKINLYDEIKPIKFFFFTYKIDDKQMYLLNYLNKIFNLNTTFEFEDYNDINSKDKILFTESLLKETYKIESDSTIFDLWKQLLLFLANDYSKRFNITSVQEYINKFSFTPIKNQLNFNDEFGFDDEYTKPVNEILQSIEKEDVIYILKNIETNHIWNFLYESIRKLENTYLKNYFIKDKKIDTSLYNFPNQSTLNFKNIYNIAKSMTHIIKNGEWHSFDSHYISLPFDNQKEFFNRFLGNKPFPQWLNLRKNIEREYGTNDNTFYNNKMNQLLSDWNTIKIDLIFDILNKSGVLNKFEVDLNLTDKTTFTSYRNEISQRIGKKFKSNPSYKKAYYYLTNEPFEKLQKIRYEDSKTNIKVELDYFTLIEKDQAWFTFYAMDWLAQISFFHRYIYHRVLYITGATGQGKSTQVPKLLMYALKAYEFNSKGKVVCTQPRIPPTKENSDRISQELGLPIIEISKKGKDKNKTNNFYVQMKYQFDSHIKNNCPHLTLKILTDGTLYEELKTNPMMKEMIYKENKKNFQYGDKNHYDIIILDESHEHNANMDMILTLTRQSCFYNNSLRLIIVSATMDDDEPVYRSYFRCINDNLLYPIKAPMYQHPIPTLNLKVFENKFVIDSTYMDRRYHISPPGETTQFRVIENYSNELTLNNLTDEEASKYVQNASYQKILEICQKYPTGEILFFSTGSAEIRKAVKELNMILPAGNVALPYYSELNQNYKDMIPKIDKTIGNIRNKRDRIFEEWGQDYIVDLSVPEGLYKRAIIIATNVAEASITINTLKFIVDNGYSKVNSYDKETGLTKLQVEKIAEASRIQRKGRVGRVSDGIAYFMYPKGSREKVVPKFKITQEDYTDYYLKLSIDESTSLKVELSEEKETGKPFIIPDQYNPNLVKSCFYDPTKCPVMNKKDDFFTKNIYLILKKQYSINNSIIIPQLYWNPKYFQKEIISNQCLNRFYTGQEIEVLVDNYGLFYIIHPFENEIERNIHNNIIAFRNVKSEKIPEQLFQKDIYMLQNKLVLINMEPSSNIFNYNINISKIVKTQLYTNVIELQKVLNDNTININDCLTLFASEGLNCFKEILCIIIFIKSFDRIGLSKDEKKFYSIWNQDSELIMYYNIFNKLQIKFKDLLLFKIINKNDELNKYTDKVNYLIELFNPLEPIGIFENNTILWNEMQKLFKQGVLNKTNGKSKIKFIIIKEFIEIEINKNLFEIKLWCTENYLNFDGIYIYLLKLTDIILNVLTLEKNLDSDSLEISPLEWIKKPIFKASFNRILKTGELKERILKSFILGRPLNYAIKINTEDKAYYLAKPNMKGFIETNNASILFYYTFEESPIKNLVKLKIINNIPLEYFTSCLPQIFNKTYFKTIIPIVKFEIKDNNFIFHKSAIELKGDNYDRILNFVHNNSLSKSPWENQELKQIYLFFKKLRNE
jgi:hypothetical protein